MLAFCTAGLIQRARGSDAATMVASMALSVVVSGVAVLSMPLSVQAQALLSESASHAAQAPASPKETAVQTAGERAQQQRDIERAEITVKRNAVEAQKLQEERDCYQRFVVESCLREVRRRARTNDTPLFNRELELNDADRKYRNALRLQDIERKKAEQAEKTAPMQSQQRPPLNGTNAVAGEAPPAAERDIKAIEAQRVQEAHQRAQTQQQREKNHEADVQQRQSAEAERRSKAKAAYEQKQIDAQERRARAAAKQAQPAAAPLPPLP